MFPDAGITKGDLIDYYLKVADMMMPHIKNRALTLHRFPDGIGADGFYQQNASDYFPDWIPRATLGKGKDKTEHAVCNDTATLVYLANQAVITPHVWLSRTDQPDHPDRMIFDLDPADDDFDTVRSAARALHEALDTLDLACFLMTTGSRGLHVVVPLDRGSDFDAVRDFARRLADRVTERAPDEFTTEQRKNKRAGRLFLDTTRNAYGQTAVAPYAVRAKPGAPVAAPLEWKELNDAKLTSRRYHLGNIARGLRQREDPWRSIGRHAVKLEAHRKRLEKL
ncbi:MAG: non-homologous end-joining DNA ligase [Gammaproteobacteria bacterium]